MVAGEVRGGRRHRPGIARWAQPHVDLVELALGRLGREVAHQPLAEPGIVGGRGQRPRSVRVGVGGCVVDEHEVQVGAHGQLVRAELAQAQDDEGAARHHAVLRREPPLGRRQQGGHHHLGDVGQRARRGFGAGDPRQHLQAGLELPAVRPAAADVERVLQVARIAQPRAQLGREHGPVRQALEEVRREHGVEQVDMAAQMVGQAGRRPIRSASRFSSSGFARKQREQLHARRQAGQELVEQPKGRVAVGLVLQRGQQRRRQLGQQLARAGGARGADMAVMPGADAPRDRRRVLEPHAGQRLQRLGVVAGAGEDEAGAGAQVRLALEQGRVVALDREQRGRAPAAPVPPARRSRRRPRTSRNPARGRAAPGSAGRPPSAAGARARAAPDRPRSAPPTRPPRPSAARPGRRERHRSAAAAARPRGRPGSAAGSGRRTRSRGCRRGRPSGRGRGRGWCRSRDRR